MGDILSVQEAADLLGCSPATIRRKIKAGELHAFRQRRPQGYEWRVYHPDHVPDHVVPPVDHVPPAVYTDLADQVSAPTDHVSPPVDQVLPHDHELLRLVERLHTENVQLAGRIGWLEAQLQQAQEQIRLLTAEKEQPVDEPEPATPMQQHQELPVPEITRGRLLRRFLHQLGIH